MSQSRQASNPKHDNPGGGATAAWIVGATLIGSGVTYFVLREVFARQVFSYCTQQAAKLLGQLPQGVRPGGSSAPPPEPMSSPGFAQIRGMF